MRTTILVVTLAGFVLPVTARAAAKESKELVARTACLSGDYAKGIRLLAELYVSTRDITFLFNQGRCFEQNGKYEEAIIRFREYQLKNTDAGNAPDRAAEKHIAKCQALLAEDSSANGSAAPKQVVETKLAIAPEPNVEIVETAAPTSPGRGLRVGGIAAAAVGVAGLATGVILNLKANSLAKDLEAANSSPTPVYSRSKASSRSTYQAWGWVAYGAGAACLAGGVLLYYFGFNQGRPGSVALAPMVDAAKVGAVLQGAF